ncbi:MAG: DUF2520 domain-containing protein, partial [Bacteroidota bacterium]
FRKNANTSNSFKNISDADVYIIAVSDTAIESVSQQLTAKKGLIVHTSGSASIMELRANERNGIFYPLQTFSKNRAVNFQNIPICIEAKKKEDLESLRKLARMISDSVYEISSEQRKSIHLAAVFVNNFTNHLYHAASEICVRNKVPFHILEPLIEETALKIKNLSPLEAQTGPARRGDTETIQKHIQQLTNDAYRDIYSLISESISTTYGEKL